ncbi:MAG: IS1 family transposase [Aureispira sp.]|nr:IS1 family transposase [Aureispira sp.]
MWSFVQKRNRKRWIWIVYDPLMRLVIAHYVGGRGERAARKLWKRIPPSL